MLKVIVIGCPGAGKSTFARKLSNKTGIPLHYLDMLWHKPNRTNISREAFDTQLSKIIQTDTWIIDGNYQRTLEARLKECDTVFLLDLPLEACLLGAESRIGKSREDLPWIETEFDEEFRQWIIDFPKTQLPEIYELLRKYQNNRNIIIFRSRKEADDYLNSRWQTEQKQSPKRQFLIDEQ
ncbi:MAG: adenylate kinase [Dorea sp.]|nr:adenylate kinase [Dorea sp.]